MAFGGKVVALVTSQCDLNPAVMRRVSQCSVKIYGFNSLPILVSYHREMGTL